FVGFHLAFGLIEVFFKAAVEFLHRFFPRHLAFFDFVQLFFHASREARVEDILKTLNQENGHLFAQHRGRKSSLVFGDIFPVDNRGNDRRVGGGTSDAFFFQFLHQSGVVVARRRLGEVLFRAQRFQAQRLALFDRRQQGLAGICFGIFVVIGGDLIDGQIAV